MQANTVRSVENAESGLCLKEKGSNENKQKICRLNWAKKEEVQSLQRNCDECQIHTGMS